MGVGQSNLSFDSAAYQGRWYEIAKYPFSFEQGCDSATADYILQGSNIQVINTCYSDGQAIKQNIGVAKPTGIPGNLLVSFDYEILFSPNKSGYLIPSFPAPYIVLWTDYSNWSFVGSVMKNFYWVLSRKDQITQKDVEFIRRKTQELGYDVSKLQWNY